VLASTTELSVTYFTKLLALAQKLETNFQYVRLGNWLEQRTIHRALAQFPDKKFLYHYNGNIRASESETQTLISNLQDWQRQTNCPWLSAHLDYHTQEEIDELFREDRRPQRYDAEQAFELLCRATQTVKAYLSVPLLLENMQHWHLPEIDIAVTPDFIRRVLEETQCGLLLDLAHARITAAILACDVQSYLEEFPLEQIVEIHVSSPRYENKHWVNSHETLQEEDYALLEWLLRRTTPRAVTLEYWKNAAQAQKQILCLNRLINRVSAG
jgi:uncharacterized protein (UPF0276 family)